VGNLLDAIEIVIVENLRRVFGATCEGGKGVLEAGKRAFELV